MSWAVLFVVLVGAGLALGWAGLRRRADPTRLLEPRTVSTAITETAATHFGRLLAPLLAAHPGLSGVHVLDDAGEAFAARMILIEGAERGVDIQYYIWHPDVAGTLLMDALRRAADRGVRVRLLLDDNGTGGLDEMMAAIDSHPNVEVRLFNPFVIRWPKSVNYLLDFGRLNRRMHNKTLTADNLLTIVGGRNIGDEYLGSAVNKLFADFDVVAMGDIVGDVSADFDRYWTCASAYPVARLLPAADGDALAVLAGQAVTAAGTALGAGYAEAMRVTMVPAVLDGSQATQWAPARLVSDDPAKGLRPVRRGALLAVQLSDLIGVPARELGVISAYFVPTAATVATFGGLAAAGVRVDVLTNALKANDIAIVHAFYAPCRVPLLSAGVRLWELKGPDAKARLRFRGSVGGGKGRRGRWGRGGFRTRGTALHGKAMTVDRQRLFIGSFNLDPRSLRLNTEIGLVVESPVLAGRFQDMFDGVVPAAAYGLRLAGRGELQWVEAGETGDRVFMREPGTGPWQRLVLRGLGRLPIKGWM